MPSYGYYTFKIGEEYWTIIDWNGAITDGRSVDDFLEIPGPDGGTTPNGWVAYWITRTKYPEIHYEAFGHAIKRDDGRICGYFVGEEEEVVEVCAGFRILSRHRTDQADAKVFQWVLAGHVTNRDETVGFVLHRIASTRHGEQIIYGDAMLLDRRFKAVRPAVFEDSIIKIGVHEFPSRVYLLVKLTPEVGPIRTGLYEGHYHDPHTDHKAHGRHGHPLPLHRPRAVETRSAICAPGWYGRECSERCSEGCEFPERCDYTSGYCSRCKQGWYGSGCSLRCYAGCESCDQNTGHCLSCRFGYHGRDCSTRCPENCDACDQSTGYCLRCKYGWYGRDCSVRCPADCETCDQASGQCINFRARPPPSQPQFSPLPKGCHRVVTKDGREFVSCYPYHRSSNNTNDNDSVEASDKRLQDPRSNPVNRNYDPIFDPRSSLYDPRYNPFDPQYDVEKDREWRAANQVTEDHSDHDHS
ncbi:unnamed protein product, partial [Mesorhabditis belari]|uniref:Uncharacterized protein n=1 Tax=Mesorhabditis belari TaxID=2138241 RepID=A0AAF3ER55_9BILA